MPACSSDVCRVGNVGDLNPSPMCYSMKGGDACEQEARSGLNVSECADQLLHKADPFLLLCLSARCSSLRIGCGQLSSSSGQSAQSWLTHCSCSLWHGRMKAAKQVPFSCHVARGKMHLGISKGLGLRIKMFDLASPLRRGEIVFLWSCYDSDSWFFLFVCF